MSIGVDFFRPHNPTVDRNDKKPRRIFPTLPETEPENGPIEVAASRALCSRIRKRL